MDKIDIDITDEVTEVLVVNFCREDVLSDVLDNDVKEDVDVEDDRD